MKMNVLRRRSASSSALAIATTLTILSLHVSAYANTTPDSTTFHLSDLAWMTGTWRGTTAQGLSVEESVSADEAGVMMAMFRVVQEGKTLVIEFATLLEKAEGVELRFRHFAPDMTAWEEEPIVMRLASWDGVEAIFENKGTGNPRRFIMKRDGENGLNARSELQTDHGVQVGELSMQRVR